MHQEYLQNDICKFQPLFDINYSILKNIISVSLFKIKKSYKDFDTYLNGLIELNDVVKNKLPEYRIRLFIDDTIHQDVTIMNVLQKLDVVDIVLFHCASFFHDTTHDGLFATMIRFFPMFDFPNNDANVVSISDADIDSSERITNRQVANITYLNQFAKKIPLDRFRQLYFFLHGKINALSTKINANRLTPYTAAANIINLRRIDHRVIIDYLQQVKNSINIHYSFYDINKISGHNTNFVFGVDEYFINKTLLTYLSKNALCYAMRYEFQLSYPIYNIFKKFHTLDSKTKKTLANIIKFVIKGDQTTNIYKKFQRMNNIIYLDPDRQQELDEKYFSLNYRLLLAYLLLKRRRKYQIMDRGTMDFIFEQVGMTMIDKVVLVNCGFSDIVMKKIMFPQKYMDLIKRQLS